MISIFSFRACGLTWTRIRSRILTADQGVSVLSCPRKLPPCGVHTPALLPLLTLFGGEGSSGLTGWDEDT